MTTRSMTFGPRGDEDSLNQERFFHEAMSDLEILKTVLQAGISVNNVDIFRRNALFYAKTSEMVNFLIEKGIDLSHQDTYGNTALICDPERDPVVFKALLDGGMMKYINVSNRYKQTALLYHGSNPAITRLLLDYGASIDDKAVFIFKNPVSLRMILEAGAKVNVLNDREAPPLFYHTNKECIRLLIEYGIDVNLADPDGLSAIFYHKDPEITKLLLDAGALIEMDNVNETTPLFFQTNPESFRLLIAAGVDVNTIDVLGEHVIYKQDNDEIVKMLLEAGSILPNDADKHISLDRIKYLRLLGIKCSPK